MQESKENSTENKDFDAKEVWQEFKETFYKKPTESELKRQSFYKQRFTPEESTAWQKTADSRYDQKDIKSITAIQRFWSRRRTSDRLMTVNPKASHNPNFLEFLHDQNIKKSINRRKLHLLLTAINEGNWRHKIFSVRYLPELAVALFANGEITPQQASTVLELSQILPEHKLLDVVPASESESILKLISQHEYFNELDPEQQTEFKLLISQLPPSEKFWFVFDGSQFNSDEANPLAQGVISAHAIYAVKSHQKLMFFCPAAGLRDALGIVRFGLKNYVKATPILGMITPYEIGEGQLQRKRYAAMKYRGTVAYREIHGQKDTEITYLIALYHDIFHSISSSIFGYEILRGLLYLADDIAQIISVDIKPKLSPVSETKETWEFKDGSAQPFMYRNPKKYNTREFRKNQLTTNEVTQVFLETILSEFDGGHHLLRAEEDSHDQYLTTAGAIFILKFLENPQRWKDIKINLNLFAASIEGAEEKLVSKPTLEFMRHYQRIKSIYSNIKNDSFKIQLLNVFLSETNRTVPTIFKAIPEMKTIAEDKFKFKKLTQKEVEQYSLPKKLANTLWSTYNGRRLEGGDKSEHKEIITHIKQSLP